VKNQEEKGEAEESRREKRTLKEDDPSLNVGLKVIKNCK